MTNSIASSTTVPPDVASSSDRYADRFSGEVGKFLLSVQRESVEYLLKDIQQSPPDERALKVLDLGGGHCQLTELYLEKGFDITIQGSDERSFERAKRLGYSSNPKVNFVISPLEDLVFKDNEFDLVSGFRLMAHVRDWNHFLSEMMRVSSRGIIFDYAKLYTFNIFNALLFPVKKLIEGNTRPFHCQKEEDILLALKTLGAVEINSKDQFIFPMGIHRLLNRPGLSRYLETLLGETPLKFLKTPGVIYSQKER